MNGPKECISDLETDTQLKLFREKLLSTSPETMSTYAFDCFKDYFESVNISEGKIRKSFATSLLVESQDLIGYDFLWNLLTECRDETIANDATEYLLKLCFTCISPKLRKGQLISKGLFGILNSSKKRTETIRPEQMFHVCHQNYCELNHI